MKEIRAGVLNVAYLDIGPSDGPIPAHVPAEFIRLWSRIKTLAHDRGNGRY